VKSSPIATLLNVTDGTLPQDMQSQIEAPITAEEFKPAMGKRRSQTMSEENGIFRILYNLLGHHLK
jgi:hypothetical protein